MTGEKGYCLSPVELLILFGVSGITESLCMELPEQKDIGRENMIKGLFHLVQNGLIEIAENQEIKIHNSIGKLLDTVCEAEKIWVQSTREHGSVKLQYLAEERITVLEQDDETGLFHLYGMKQEEWKLTVTDRHDGKELNSTQEGALLEKYMPEVQAEREEFTHDFLWNESDQRVFEVWELIQKEKRECEIRIIFMEGILFSWMIVQQEETMEVFYNSREERNALERKLRKIE